MATFPHRLVGAAVLDVLTNEEVEADRAATVQAAVVVVASSLATGIGASGFGGHPGAMMENVFIWSVVALLGWAAWALLVLQIGGRLMPQPQTRVDVTELLRTIGFSTAPGLLRVLGVLPALTIPVFALTTTWMLIAMVRRLCAGDGAVAHPITVVASAAAVPSLSSPARQLSFRDDPAFACARAFAFSSVVLRAARGTASTGARSSRRPPPSIPAAAS